MRSPSLILFLILGYLFLYVPILSLVIFSFNDSVFMNGWYGFTLKWYFKLMENDALFTSLFTSLKIATIAATFAVILGTLAAVVMVRFGRFFGRTLFGGLISAPLIMPDVITGLAMLLLFVTMESLIGWPKERGITTVTIAHITFAMAYVSLVVQARLKEFDKSIEEAALDLGAKPYKVFLFITLPIISPALLSGWLLSFALSLDDVVIASFLSGPGSTTLPMLIFSSVRLGLSPEINALASLIIAVVALGVGIAGMIVIRNQRKGV